MTDGTSVPCSGCGLRNPVTRATCMRCGKPLDLWQALRDEARAGSIPASFYAAAFVLSCVAGAALTWVLQWLFGSRLLESDAGLMGAFLLGTVASLVAIIRFMRRWKTEGRGASDGRSSRVTLFAYAGVLALLGGLLLYQFAEWEHTGGTRRWNALLLVVYDLVGKWGVAALCWLGSAAIVRTALQRRR